MRDRIKNPMGTFQPLANYFLAEQIREKREQAQEERDARRMAEFEQRMANMRRSLDIRQQNADTSAFRAETTREHYEKQDAYKQGTLDLGWAKQDTNQYKAETQRMHSERQDALAEGKLTLGQDQLAEKKREYNLSLEEKQYQYDTNREDDLTKFMYDRTYKEEKEDRAWNHKLELEQEKRDEKAKRQAQADVDPINMIDWYYGNIGVRRPTTPYSGFSMELPYSWDEDPFEG